MDIDEYVVGKPDRETGLSKNLEFITQIISYRSVIYRDLQQVDAVAMV